MKETKEPFPLATALISGLKTYNINTFRQDAVAGFIVSMLALPLSMALAIAVGLPPQHGIYTAIVAGIAAAIFGGSPTQVSGPTAAFVVIIAPIVSQFGLHGIMWCSIMAGFFLLLMGSCGFGKYINYVPYQVTTGFTAGIAVVIATISLNDFLGLGIEHMGDSYIDKITSITSHISNLSIYDLSVGMLTILLILFFGRITRKIPTTIVGLSAGTLLAYLLANHGIEIATIGSRFTYESGGVTMHGIPPLPPTLHIPGSDLLSLPSQAEIRDMLMPSLTIAALAALESLLSATVADSMAGTRHNPNAELNGIGIANIFSGMAAGIPATGAIARTAANIHSGAKTPVASIIHALLITAYIMLMAPVISYIPMASLAALLLVTAWRMSHIKQFIRTIEVAPASDTLVLLTCFILTVFVDMVAGVGVGIVLAAFMFMKRISDLTEFKISSPEAPTPLPDGIALPDNVMIYRLSGPLFFGSVERAFGRYRFAHDHIEKLIIDMENVPLIDISGMVAIKNMLSNVAHEKREVIICGKPEITNRIMNKIKDHDVSNFVRASHSLISAVESLQSRAS